MYSEAGNVYSPRGTQATRIPSIHSTHQPRRAVRGSTENSRVATQVPSIVRSDNAYPAPPHYITPGYENYRPGAIGTYGGTSIDERIVLRATGHKGLLIGKSLESDLYNRYFLRLFNGHQSSAQNAMLLYLRYPSLGITMAHSISRNYNFLGNPQFLRPIKLRLRPLNKAAQKFVKKHGYILPLSLIGTKFNGLSATSNELLMKQGNNGRFTEGYLLI